MDFMLNDTCDELESYSMNCTLDEVRNLSSYDNPNCSDALSSLMEARCSMGGVCQERDGPNLERGGTIAIVQALSLVGNICTILILSKFKVHKIPDVLVVGLAITDLLAALIPIPMSLYAYFAGINFAEGCILCDFFGVIAMFTRCSSVQIVSFVGVERYLAVNRPFIYRKHATPKKFIVVLLFGWALAILVAVIPVIGGNTIITSHTGFCFFDITSYYALSIVLYSVIHFSTVLICFLLVTIELTKVYRRRKRLKVQDKYNSNSRAQLRENSLSFTKSNFTSRFVGVCVFSLFLVCMCLQFVSVCICHYVCVCILSKSGQSFQSLVLIRGSPLYEVVDIVWKVVDRPFSYFTPFRVSIETNLSPKAVKAS